MRLRRLTVSAFELQNSNLKVIDIAVKYSYDSHASFARAFREFHGVSPSQARSKRAIFNIYPRMVFQVQNFEKESRGFRMAALGNIEIIRLPASRMIGIKVINGRRQKSGSGVVGEVL